MVEDKNGNKLQLDGEGTIRVDAKDTLEFTSGQSKIVFDKNGLIKISGRAVEIDSTEDIKIRSASKVEVQGARITLN